LAAGHRLRRVSIARRLPEVGREENGGAPLLAVFEKGPAEPPTPFDSALPAEDPTDEQAAEADSPSPRAKCG
jgi:hypothetical protein